MGAVVLVTAIGTATSTAIVLRRRELGNYHIIGGDIFKWNQVVTAKDVDEFYQFPSAVEEFDSYIDFMAAFCKEHNVDFYFASIDEEIANLSRNRERFEAIGVRLCIPNHELIMTCHYKNAFSDWVEVHFPEIWIKRYRTLLEVEDKAFPLFIKPVEGRASLGCRKIADKEALEEWKSKETTESNVIIQEYVEGEIITVDFVRNARTGHNSQVQRIENLRNSSGCGIAVEIINDPILNRICSRLMEMLNLNGVVNAEFFRDGSKYRIIEINPRFSAGTSFSCLAGCDTVTAALDLASGNDFKLGESEIGLHLAKRYETYRMD